MRFQPGNKLAGSRRGIPNKRSVKAIEILERAGFCPIQALMDTYRIAIEQFKTELERLESGRYSPMESQASTYLKIAAQSASGLAGYAYPRLKSIEQKTANPTDGMTAEEKLEAAKRMVQLLEAQVKADGPEPT